MMTRMHSDSLIVNGVSMLLTISNVTHSDHSKGQIEIDQTSTSGESKVDHGDTGTHAIDMRKEWRDYDL